MKKGSLSQGAFQYLFDWFKAGLRIVSSEVCFVSFHSELKEGRVYIVS